VSWTKLDDGFVRHPKVIGLSDRAFRLHIEALCLCSEHLTDGILPTAWVRRQPQGPVRELVEAGLWSDSPWSVHDYLSYNPSRADIEGSREQARERMREVRANPEENANRMFDIGSPAQPLRTSTRSLDESAEFVAFYSAYPRKIGRRTAHLAFERALLRTSAKEIIQGAQRLATDPNLPEERFIPHPTTWLNRDGWLDGPLAPERISSTRRLMRLAETLEETEG
jgi:hypothetical protein